MLKRKLYPCTKQSAQWVHRQFLVYVVVVVVVNLYLTRVILSEYFKEYLLSIGALIKLIYKYVKILKIQNK